MNADTRLVWKRFEEFDVRELYAVLQLRSDVFVVEQNCAYPDIDGQDTAAIHLLARAAGDLAPLSGCLRIFGPGGDGAPARIGRVVTARAARGQGLGRRMMVEALAEIERRFGGCAVEISAQVESESFYTGLGFRRVSEDYDEDGIAHCTMWHGTIGRPS